jgi:alpha-ketoglutarate-dependent taurine dioxygenase
MRTAFDRDFTLARATLAVEDCTTITGRIAADLVTRINRFGFAVIEYAAPADHERQQLPALQKIFGDITRHRRSDADGTTPIAVSADFPGFLGASSGRHAPHTDGAFDACPPHFVALQCLIPAKRGGHTQLISGRGLYDALRARAPETLAALFAPDTLTVSRDGEVARAPIFSRAGSHVELRFRDDATSSFAERQLVSEGVELLRQHVSAAENVLEFRLERRQIVVVDNRGVLHGRTAFDPSGNRQLLRATFDGRRNAENGLACGFADV